MLTMTDQLTFEIDSEDGLREVFLASSLAALTNSGEQLALKGDLGAGKTVFARAFVRALCGQDTEVPSPTFTILQSYDTPDFPVWHFDLYRLKAPEEALELDLEEAFSSTLSLIEWPDRLGPYLPPSHLDIQLEYIGDKEGTRRRLTLTPSGDWVERLQWLKEDSWKSE